jgi:hypothetical protein
MSAEHPTDVTADVDELDEFGRQVVAEAEVLPPIQPTVELTQAETDQLCDLLARVRGALSSYYEQGHASPHDQALTAALDDLTQRKHHAWERAHQATMDRARAHVQRAYQQPLPRQHDHGPQRGDQQGGGADER